MDEHSTTWLLGRVRGGDERAFATLVGRHESALLRYARGILGAGGPFEDVVQDAFLKLAGNPPRLAPETPGAEHHRLGRWLLQVTRNHCMDWMRAETRRRRRETDRAVPEATAGGLDVLEARDSRRFVERTLDALPDGQREVLVLRLLGDKSYREIAEITGKSVGTVGWLISAGLAALTAQLGPELGDDPRDRVAVVRRDD